MTKVDDARRHIISRLREGREMDRHELFKGTKWSRRTCLRALKQVAVARYEGFGPDKKVWYKLDRERTRARRIAVDKYGSIVLELRERMLDTEDPAERIALGQALKRLK